MAKIATAVAASAQRQKAVAATKSTQQRGAGTQQQLSQPPQKRTREEKAKEPTLEARFENLVRSQPDEAHEDSTMAPALPAATPDLCEWAESDDTAWVLFVNPKHQAKADALLVAHPLWVSLGSAELEACTIERANIPSKEAWTKLQELAILVVGESSAVIDSKLPGTLVVWPERTYTGTRDKDGRKVWGEVERWKGDRPLARMADHLLSIEPKCRLGVQIKHGRPSLVVQAGEGLTTVLSRLQRDQLQYELNQSTLSTGFLEITSTPEAAPNLIWEARKVHKELDRRYPGLIWVRSFIAYGVRSIAMVPRPLTANDTFFRTEGGVTMRFFINAVEESQSECKINNALIVEEAVSDFCTKAASQAQALPRPVPMVEDGQSPTVEALVEQRREMMLDVVTGGDQATDALRTAMHVMTECHVPPVARRAAAQFAMQSAPVQAAARQRFFNELKDISSPVGLAHLVATLGNADDVAQKAFREAIATEAPLPDGRMFAPPGNRKSFAAAAIRGRDARPSPSSSNTASSPITTSPHRSPAAAAAGGGPVR